MAIPVVTLGATAIESPRYLRSMMRLPRGATIRNYHLGVTPTCPAGQVYDYTLNACRPAVGSTGDGAPSTGITWWPWLVAAAVIGVAGVIAWDDIRGLK